MYNCDDNYHDHGQDHIQNHDEDCCGKTCPELVRGCKVNASSTSLGHPAHDECDDCDGFLHLTHDDCVDRECHDDHGHQVHDHGQCGDDRDCHVMSRLPQ